MLGIVLSAVFVQYIVFIIILNLIKNKNSSPAKASFE